jgi:hypothetical protein
VTPELGIEICKRQGLKALVAPEIAAFGNTYLITLEAIDARTQKVIARRQEVAENKDKVIAALGKAGSQLRRQLGESLSSLEKYDAPLDLATTSSLEALQAYRTGQALFRPDAPLGNEEQGRPAICQLRGDPVSKKENSIRLGWVFDAFDAYFGYYVWLLSLSVR